MFSAKFLMLYTALAGGVWGVSYGNDQWQVLVQVVCAVVVSMSIFLAVLHVSEPHASKNLPGRRPLHPTISHGVFSK